MSHLTDQINEVITQIHATGYIRKENEASVKMLEAEDTTAIRPGFPPTDWSVLVTDVEAAEMIRLQGEINAARRAILAIEDAAMIREFHRLSKELSDLTGGAA